MRGWLRELRPAARGTRVASALVHALLLAFLLQIVATRGHFHFGDTAATHVVAAQQLDNGADPSGPSKVPAHQETDCPLWHASLLCGSAVHATTVTIVAPLLRSARAPIDQRTIVPERFNAAWRSRAPPIL